MRVLHRGAGRLAAAWVGLWGCGRGPVRRLSPQARIVAGGMVLAACLLAPTSGSGVALLAVAAGGWIAVCGLPWRVLRAIVVVGAAALLPVVLLAGVAAGGGVARWAGAVSSLAVTGELLLRGLAATVVAASTAAVLRMTDLRAGLAALPVPGVVAAITLQIVHQTGALLEETGRVAAAVTVRASGRGRMRLLVSLPGVWLPRLLARAERVADAMEVRGVGEPGPAQAGVRPAALADGAALLVLAALVALAGALRWGWDR